MQMLTLRNHQFLYHVEKLKCPSTIELIPKLVMFTIVAAVMIQVHTWIAMDHGDCQGPLKFQESWIHRWLMVLEYFVLATWKKLFNVYQATYIDRLHFVVSFPSHKLNWPGLMSLEHVWCFRMKLWYCLCVYCAFFKFESVTVWSSICAIYFYYSLWVYGLSCDRWGAGQLFRPFTRPTCQ